jgi:hypothetical protein
MTEADMKKVNKALSISLNLSWVKNKKNFKGYIVYYITLCVTLKTLMKIKVYHKFK